MERSLVNNEFERTWVDAVVAYLRHYSADHLEVITKAKRNAARFPVKTPNYITCVQAGISDMSYIYWHVLTFSGQLTPHTTYNHVQHIYIIIIINIKDWTLWSVPSPQLQQLAPTLLRSSNCSPSLWSVAVWFQRDSVLWRSLQMWKPIPSVFIYLVYYACNP